MVRKKGHSKSHIHTTPTTNREIVKVLKRTIIDHNGFQHWQLRKLDFEIVRKIRIIRERITLHRHILQQGEVLQHERPAIQKQIRSDRDFLDRLSQKLREFLLLHRRELEIQALQHVRNVLGSENLLEVGLVLHLLHDVMSPAVLHRIHSHQAARERLRILHFRYDLFALLSHRSSVPPILRLRFIL